MDYERIIQVAINNGIRIGCTETMKALGVTSGELSERQATKVYGTFFTEAVRTGGITPARTGAKAKYYSVSDILSYRARKEIKAEIAKQKQL